MRAETRLRRARAVLALCAAISAVGWGIATAAVPLLLGALIDRIVAIPLFIRQLALVLSIVGGAAALLAVLWRNRDVRFLTGVALWLEGR